ncbi:hypothetical protein [Parenemella sanctibonifatiensis]|uniref:Uncharacterized protein n=1 Tax=Parenemella sanctibonifatiensis TaxID=2016505 RepID=A0A255EL61_9ACTN|nr:hypothetical protein [Parenemella sanctibonifatiensis]OYN90345.1 hypothetical protein CGZ91_09305 [Parenemella sanctibonifatiensis]OYN90660.1 hypothetical protein CGZ92_00485 [Parenemella sanctibonifatiensis]
MSTLTQLPRRTVAALTIAMTWLLAGPDQRNERGLSQSTENAILLAGAVTVGGIVVAAVIAFVQNNLPR